MLRRACPTRVPSAPRERLARPPVARLHLDSSPKHSPLRLTLSTNAGRTSYATQLRGERLGRPISLTLRFTSTSSQTNAPPSASPTSSSSPATPPSAEPEKKNKSSIGKLAAQYGAAAPVVYIGISLLHLGFWWAIVSLGVDVNPLFQRVGITPPAALASASTFAAAYIIHKLLAPLRIAIIVAVLAKYGTQLSDLMATGARLLRFK